MNTTTNHRAPTRGARTHREGTVAGSVAAVVAQHRCTASAVSSPQTATRARTPWRAGVALARVQGSDHPLRALLHPGALQPPERHRALA